MSQEQVQSNINQFRKEFERINNNIEENLISSKSYYGKMPEVEYVNNIDFYKDMNVIDFLRDVGKHYRIGTMLSKDSVKSRMN